MFLAYELLNVLCDGKFHSGSILAKQLRVSRVSIWKGIQHLESLGLKIFAVRGRGYRLASSVELLSSAKIQQQLSSTVSQQIQRIDTPSVVSSTMDYVKDFALRRLPNFSVCVAECQTAGRGRQGRRWLSPFGANIYLSLYCQFKALRYGLSGLSLVMGIAVLKALETYGIPLSLKWPNDIYYENKKCVGILIESNYSSENSVHDVFFGIGININQSLSGEPQIGTSEYEVLQNSTDLKQILKYLPSRNEVIAKVLNQVIPHLNEFQEKGFQPFVEDWSKYDLLQGRSIKIIRESNSMLGIGKGVNERGELLLEHDGVLKAISMGEVKLQVQMT